MKCAWNNLLGILPPQMRAQVDKKGREELLEIRLRKGRPTELVMLRSSDWLKDSGAEEDMKFIINSASRYSPWAAESISSGYITAPGGHRIGICGEVVQHNGNITGIRNPTSVCVRIARDFPGIASQCKNLSGNVLLIGPPGSGKTTLLRDLIRLTSQSTSGAITVVDERGEIFPVNSLFDTGPRTDVLTGCGKVTGIEMALKTMGPSCIVVDEVTSEKDCLALLQAAWCGVRVFATAHAASMADLRGKAAYRQLVDSKLFDWVLILQKDKSWKVERIGV